MSLVLTAAPAVEPVTLAEAKAQCRVDGSIEDAFMSSLVTTSRLHIETALGLGLITQDWSWTLDAWPRGGCVELPVRPVQTINAVVLTRPEGGETIVSADDYVLDGSALPPRLCPLNAGFPNPQVPYQGVEIRFTAGFGDTAADVPAPIRQALLLLVAHWFENREPVTLERSPAVRIPDTVSELLQPFRLARI